MDGDASHNSVSSSFARLFSPWNWDHLIETVSKRRTIWISSNSSFFSLADLLAFIPFWKVKDYITSAVFISGCKSKN